MITEKWLKEELDKIDDRIYWEIAVYGNVDHVINVFNKYLETQVKLCNKPAVINNEVAACGDCYYAGDCDSAALNERCKHFMANF